MRAADSILTPSKVYTPLLAGKAAMSSGARYRNGLSPSKIRAIKPAEKRRRYGDGDGLSLLCDPAAKGGNKRFEWTGTVRNLAGGIGKPVTIGIGNTRDVTLADARAFAQLYRMACAKGINPREISIVVDKDGRPFVDDWAPAVPPRIESRSPVFSDAFEEFYAFRRQDLTNDKFARQWLSEVERHAYPVLGGLRVASITHVHLGKVLQPIWRTKADTASKVAQRLNAFFDFATAKGWRTGDNPVTIARSLLRPQPKGKQKPRPAMDWRRIPEFWQAIDDLPNEPQTLLALRAIILTASRSQEVRLAKLNWIDAERNALVRPAKVMKSRDDHAVPITPVLATVIDEARKRFKVRASDLIFPGFTPGGPLSDSALSKLMRDAGYQNVAVPHGFRSTFIDWAADNGHSSDVAERQAAHALDKVRGAYERTDLFERRVRLMHLWETYVTTGRNEGV